MSEIPLWVVLVTAWLAVPFLGLLWHPYRGTMVGIVRGGPVNRKGFWQKSVGWFRLKVLFLSFWPLAFVAAIVVVNLTEDHRLSKA